MKNRIKYILWLLYLVIAIAVLNLLMWCHVKLELIINGSIDLHKTLLEWFFIFGLLSGYMMIKSERIGKRNTRIFLWFILNIFLD